jgi:NADH:ubiquinone oxidoreductase subunit F (NADH-binding)
MAHRPHVVLDGALLAAAAVGADEVLVYVGSEHRSAVAAIGAAIAERARVGPPIRLVPAPVGYVAGEATAAVHFVNAGDARPTANPPRMSERGVDGRPTLVQNVESLAWAALIARLGPDWYLHHGRASTPGRALVTISGEVPREGIAEIELGTTVRELVLDAGGDPRRLGGVVLGGYFGTWVSAPDALDLPLDPIDLKAAGLTFGCGIVGLLGDGECGLVATGRILGFLAAESAGQCGPCVWGLRAIADTVSALAAGAATPEAGEDLRRWAGLVTGRGACRHPDGAAQLLMSALVVFGDDVEAHLAGRACVATGTRTSVAA